MEQWPRRITRTTRYGPLRRTTPPCRIHRRPAGHSRPEGTRRGVTHLGGTEDIDAPGSNGGSVLMERVTWSALSSAFPSPERQGLFRLPLGIYVRDSCPEQRPSCPLLPITLPTPSTPLPSWPAEEPLKTFFGGGGCSALSKERTVGLAAPSPHYAPPRRRATIYPRYSSFTPGTGSTTLVPSSLHNL